MIIVRTKDSKMMQDTVVGVVITPFRPHLTELSSFTEGRLNKSEYRPQELEILVSDFAPNDGVSDKTLGDDWKEYKAGLKKGEQEDFQGFADKWAKENGRVGKKKAAAEGEGNPAPQGGQGGRQGGGQRAA